MAEVLVGQGAEDDYMQSLRWYAEHSTAAATGFEAEVERALASIAEYPARYPMCDERHRVFLLRRYPFHVIYRALSGERLLVVAIAHTSRQPRYWTER
jgi:plasmid stabilization system protein ParE